MGHSILVWCLCTNFYHLLEKSCLLCFLYFEGVFLNHLQKLPVAYVDLLCSLHREQCCRSKSVMWLVRLYVVHNNGGIIIKQYRPWWSLLKNFITFLDLIYLASTIMSIVFTTECSYSRRSADCFTSRVVCKLLQYSPVSATKKNFLLMYEGFKVCSLGL
jgi:hypothetical protein